MDVIQEPRSVRKNLARLAVPIFIETLLIMMLGAVDTVMLSQYSDNSVAAVGVVNQLIMFAFLIFEVINIGTSVLCSQYLGARMHKNMVHTQFGVRSVCQCHFALWSHFSAIYDGTSSRTDGIWSELHEDSRGIRFFSSHISDYFCLFA